MNLSIEHFKSLNLANALEVGIVRVVLEDGSK